MADAIKPLKNRQRFAFVEQNLFEEFCAYLACGMSMKSICALDGMPNVLSVFKKVHENDINTQMYLRARQQGTLVLAEDILSISDNVRGNVDRDRLRVDSRKFLMSKMNRALFGDNIQVEGNPNKPIVIKWLDGESDKAKVIDGTINANVAEHDSKQD